MAAEAPNSYKDPFWSQAASGVEEKLGLPNGLLVSVLTRGERSNADQVSEAGARTPFQIIPATRKAAIDKYGIDAYLSPENAAEVAGRLLKDSLDRNQGDPALAVAEYHGGTNRQNWGPRTRAYVQRVVSALPSAVTPQSLPATTVDLPTTPTGSTFDRVSAQMKAAAPADNAMANVFAAYQAGKMPPEDAQQFEQDVKAGLVMLPRGATLKGAVQDGPPAPMTLPSGVVQAYQSGAMPEADRKQLEDDLRAGLVALPASGAQLVPGSSPLPAPEPKKPLLTRIGDTVKGVGETANALLDTAIATPIGTVAGVVKTVAEGAGYIATAADRGPRGVPMGLPTDPVPVTLDKAVTDSITGLVRQPTTKAGQEMTDAAASALQNAVPLIGHGAEVAAVGSAAAPKVGSAITKVAGAVDEVRQAARDAVARTLTLGSVGSAGADAALLRRQAAADLPVPLRLTKGMETRDPAQLKFEVETAKSPDLGGPLRQRTAELNDGILRNFDAWADQSGAEAPNLRAVGAAVDKALVEKAARDKAAIRVAYKEAEKAGEMAEPVSLGTVVAHLNDSAPEATTAPILNTARALALKLGIATEEGGTLAPQSASLAAAEQFRKAINRATDYEPTNIRQATIIKGLVDEATQNAGGDLYRAARRMRENFAKQYENRAVIAKLLNTRRGTQDRQVAFEDVFDHTVLRGPLDDVRHVRRVLQTGGADGQQAWRELQGATLNYLRNEATKNVATDARGNPVVSAAGLDKAIRNLDRDGKLDFIFGKKGAQQLRDLNDLAKWIKTVPPEAAVNVSNTAATLLSAFADAGVIGASGGGVPVPVVTMARMALRHVKDEKLRRRISDALGENVKQAPGRPTGATIH